MMISTTPTPESMRLTLSMLRDVRCSNDRDESLLRGIRHCLATHLKVPGMMTPIGGRKFEPVSDEQMLAIVLDGVAVLEGEDESDAAALARIKQVVEVQLSDRRSN